MGESQLFISLVPANINEPRDPGGAAQAAELVAELAPYVGCALDVLEPGIYWGAYRPVLGALQAAALGGTLPLQNCLLSCDDCDLPPAYMRGSYSNKAQGTYRGVDRTYDLRDIYNERAAHLPASVPDVLAPWPQLEQWASSCDRWQLQAAKALLTHQCALVQGPPGTGKTYVGLLVMRALLRNKKLWGAPQAGAPPSTASSRNASAAPSRNASAAPSRNASVVPSRAVSGMPSRVASVTDLSRAGSGMPSRAATPPPAAPPPIDRLPRAAPPAAAPPRAAPPPPPPALVRPPALRPPPPAAPPQRVSKFSAPPPPPPGGPPQQTVGPPLAAAGPDGVSVVKADAARLEARAAAAAAAAAASVRVRARVAEASGVQGGGGGVQLAAAKEIAARLSAAKEPGVAAEGEAAAPMPGSSGSTPAGTAQAIEDIELGDADLLMTDEQANAALGEAAATDVAEEAAEEEAEEEAQATGEAVLEDVEEAAAVVGGEEEEEAEQLEALRVGELRARLGERGLATEGRKAELVVRLREVLLEEAQQLGGDETPLGIPAWYPASPSHPASPPPPSAPPSPAAEEGQEEGQEAGEAVATPARRTFTGEDLEQEERLHASHRAVKAAIGEAEDDEAEEAEAAEAAAVGGEAGGGGGGGGGGTNPSMPVVVEEDEEEEELMEVEQEAGPRPPPILVLCVTNHALDQVLEGILPFESSVVRVGGRSKSVALKEKNLQPLLEASRSKRTGPIKNALRSLSAEMRPSKARLASSLALVQAAHGTGPLEGGGTVLSGSMLTLPPTPAPTPTPTFDPNPHPNC